MSLDYQVRYSAGFLPGDGNYPFGIPKNSTTETSEDGAPWDQDGIKDWHGFFQGLLSRNGITPSGNADTVNVSDYLDALGFEINKPFVDLQQAVDSTNKTRIFDGAHFNIKERTIGNGGGGIWDAVLSSTVTENTFNIVQCVGVPTLSLVLRVEGFANVKQFGATGDGVTNDALSIQAAVDFMGLRGGGAIYIPATPDNYFIAPVDDDKACVWIHYNRITIFGDGGKSLLRTGTNSHVPLHFSDEQSLTTVPSGTELTDFEVYGIAVQGTGIFENFSLAKGRGILFRNVINVSVHDNLITSMSMIGIVSEAGDGYFRVQNNQIHSCRFSAINYNGRCYQSIISGNICSKSNAGVNSISIQATGHCIITGNTVFGEIGNAANCGGIVWGEGNYDGIGVISNNLIKHTAFGIEAIFHGSVSITGNTIINALARSGILFSGTISGPFTVANSDSIINGNLIINCFPNGIDCSAEDTLISNNKVRNFSPITNPSASSEPDFIVGVTTQQGIRVRAKGCSVTNNHVSGCVHGLTTTILQVNGNISGNKLTGNTNQYTLESETAGVFAAVGHAIIERELIDTNLWRERIARATLPSQGFFNKGSTWNDPTPAIGQPTGQLVLFADDQATVAVEAVATDTVIELSSTANILGTGTESIIGFELDNGAWHWTTVDSVASPNVTIGTGIPTGRTSPVGAEVAYTFFRPLANLA